MRRSVIFAVGLVAAVAAATAWALAQRGGAPGRSEPEAEAPGPVLRLVEPRRGAPTCLGTRRGEFVSTLRAYLDFEAPKAAHHRLQLLVALRRLTEDRCDPISEPDAFLDLLYEARPFDAPIDRTSVGKDTTLDVDAARGIASVDGQLGRFSFRLPASYPKDAKALNATPPFPMIVTLLESQDFQPRGGIAKFPGAEAIRRRYPGAPDDPLTEGAIVFAPVATRARFSTDGAIAADTVPLHQMWRRYHVDFDRIVIDGGSDALLFAAAHAIYYAGVIVRGDEADVDPDLVRNFAHLDVYVVGTERSAARRSLLAGGMPRAHVRVGDAAGIAPWLERVRRSTPLAFSWVVKDKNAQRFAHWVNVNELDPAVAAPTLRAEAVDTEADPNTVRIVAIGVRNLSIFLNDRIVDLDRPLRLVVNDAQVPNVRLLRGSPGGKIVRLPGLLSRSADVMLDASRELSVRRSRYYGFLFPVVADGIALYPFPGSGIPSPEQIEAEAVPLLAAARAAHAAGDGEKARRLLRRLLELGETPSRSAAMDLQKELWKLEGR